MVNGKDLRTSVGEEEGWTEEGGLICFLCSCEA